MYIWFWKFPVDVNFVLYQRPLYDVFYYFACFTYIFKKVCIQLWLVILVCRKQSCWYHNILILVFLKSVSLLNAVYVKQSHKSCFIMVLSNLSRREFCQVGCFDHRQPFSP